jgi:hypothetical protein
MAADRLRLRFLPALLTASGVTLLAAGLLSYTTPVTAEPAPSARPRPSATTAPTPSPRITLPPLASAPPATPSATAGADRVASRVRVAALDIDLPVVKGPAGYPYCDVAMWLDADQLGQPGQGRATYLFGHAREGMFLPLLRTPEKEQLGIVVEVWTNGGWRYLYEIIDVRRGQTTLDDALDAEGEELWLQTSEGPRGTPGKTQVIARPLSVERADLDEANPEARIDRCE